jgi:hypothetical protein
MTRRLTSGAPRPFRPQSAPGPKIERTSSMRWNLAGAALLVLGLTGCVSVGVVVSNYKPGTLVSATVGFPLIDVKVDSRSLVASPPGDSRQLIYGGRSGDTIKLTYREYRRPGRGDLPEAQELQFDLSRSNRITFQEMRLEVIEASSERIVATVLPHAREDSRGKPLEPGSL